MKEYQLFLIMAWTVIVPHIPEKLAQGLSMIALGFSVLFYVFGR